MSDDVRDQPGGGEENQIIVMNGNDPVFFWQPSTQQALRALSEAPLRGADGELSDTPLLAHAEGRRFLSYVVTCALPEGDVLKDAAGTVSFHGAVGLASEWSSGALRDVASQRWVTACLLQTLNKLGMEVEVLMTGRHRSLGERPDASASDYTTPDATMFGNLFHADGAVAFSCTDTEVSTTCDIDLSQHMAQRLCDQSPTCGVTPLGPCDRSCTDVDGHPSCRSPEGDRYAEAISTYVHSTLSLGLPMECSP
ncbi:hypothetical protein [Sorangium sp. So ce1335]|uniref:hypothetical protein n=1 Tax=Sorangium sp. So ce1335 TaxID=3133335 RepID=UPI003F62B610